MDSPGEQHNDEIVFEALRSTVFGNVLFASLAGIFVGIGLPGIAIVVLALTLSWGVSPPTTVVGAALFALGLLAARTVWRGRCISRVTLGEELITFRGPFVTRRVDIDNARLVQLSKPGKTTRELLRVEVIVGRLNQPGLYLAASEAEECFHMLRQLCSHAPAIGLESESYSPVDPAHQSSGDRILRRAHWRNAIIALIVGMLTAITVTVYFNRSPPNASGTGLGFGQWVSIIGSCLAAIAMFVQAVRMLLARNTRAANHVQEAEVDGGDDDGE